MPCCYLQDTGQSMIVIVLPHVVRSRELDFVLLMCSHSFGFCLLLLPLKLYHSNMDEEGSEWCSFASSHTRTVNEKGCYVTWLTDLGCLKILMPLVIVFLDAAAVGSAALWRMAFSHSSVYVSYFCFAWERSCW
jgi:flagellar biosynthesis protein FlhB